MAAAARRSFAWPLLRGGPRCREASSGQQSRGHTAGRNAAARVCGPGHLEIRREPQSQDWELTEPKGVFLDPVDLGHGRGRRPRPQSRPRRRPRPVVTHAVGHDLGVGLGHVLGCGTTSAAKRDDKNATCTMIADWWSRRGDGGMTTAAGSRAPSAATTSSRNFRPRRAGHFYDFSCSLRRYYGASATLKPRRPPTTAAAKTTVLAALEPRHLPRPRQCLGYGGCDLGRRRGNLNAAAPVPNAIVEAPPTLTIAAGRSTIARLPPRQQPWPSFPRSWSLSSRSSKRPQSRPLPPPLLLRSRSSWLRRTSRHGCIGGRRDRSGPRHCRGRQGLNLRAAVTTAAAATNISVGPRPGSWHWPRPRP